MKLYKLNAEQKALLQKILELVETGKLKEPITPVPSEAPSNFSIYLRGEKSFRFKRLSDLDALCDAGLMTYRWNRQGTGKLYFLTAEAQTAVSTNFNAPKTAVGYDIDLAELVRAMSGGQVQIEALGTHLDLAYLPSDPLLRHTVVHALTERLTQFAQQHLPWDLFMPYQKQVRALRDLLLSEEVDNGRLQILAHHLAFPPYLTERVDFSLKAWIYLYPLLLIGSARIEYDQAEPSKSKKPAPFPSPR